MSKEIPFNTVMRDPRSWCDEMNLDNMMENHIKLKPIINKMFFTEWPKHPELFTILFSQDDFADRLIEHMVDSGITELNKVFFTEYGLEDKIKLVKMGFLDLIPIYLGLSAVQYVRNGENYYVNLIP